MGTNEAQAYLRNTELEMKFKAISAIVVAAILAGIVILEAILDRPMSALGDVYVVCGLVLLIATGGILKALKIASKCFTWGYLLTPFVLFDLVIAVLAGGWVLAMQILFPFIPIALVAFDLYRKRLEARKYL